MLWNAVVVALFLCHNTVSEPTAICSVVLSTLHCFSQYAVLPPCPVRLWLHHACHSQSSSISLSLFIPDECRFVKVSFLSSASLLPSFSFCYPAVMRRYGRTDAKKMESGGKLDERRTFTSRQKEWRMKAGMRKWWKNAFDCKEVDRGWAVFFSRGPYWLRKSTQGGPQIGLFITARFDVFRLTVVCTQFANNSFSGYVSLVILEQAKKDQNSNSQINKITFKLELHTDYFSSSILVLTNLWKVLYWALQLLNVPTWSPIKKKTKNKTPSCEYLEAVVTHPIINELSLLVLLTNRKIKSVMETHYSCQRVN